MQSQQKVRGKSDVSTNNSEEQSQQGSGGLTAQISGGDKLGIAPGYDAVGESMKEKSVIAELQPQRGL